MSNQIYTENQPLLSHNVNSINHDSNYKTQDAPKEFLYPTLQQDTIPQIQTQQQTQQQQFTTQTTQNTNQLPINTPSKTTGQSELDKILASQTIPTLTLPQAQICLILNLIFPGLGTIYAAMTGSSIDNYLVLMGVIQTMTSSLLIGALWAIIWSVLVYMKAQKSVNFVQTTAL